MKTKEEILILAELHAKGLPHATIRSNSFKKGYSKCQEDILAFAEQCVKAALEKAGDALHSDDAGLIFSLSPSEIVKEVAG